MRKSITSSKKTIHLNLTKKWFDMILSGEKITEYRALSPYFCEKILLMRDKPKKKAFWETFFLFCDNNMIKESVKELLNHSAKGRLITFKDFDTITFSNGYAKNRRQFEIVHLKTIVSRGDTYWGAVDDVMYFNLLLGNIIQDNLEY